MNRLFVWLMLLGIGHTIAICRTKGKNVILILTDDQDIELGSMQFMPKTRNLLQIRGVTFNSGFVSTPICCPSRTSILTGQYVHNHNVFTNNQNCSGLSWRDIYEKRTFAVYLQEKNYATAYFGKYLNEYDGSYQPPGWDEWMGLVKNSRFYNYTINFNGDKIKHGFDYERDYFTDLIANDTITFLNKHCERQPTKPFLVVLSFPAPHGPEDPAPQYSNLFENVETHRTPSWNYAPNPDKEWILQHTGRMEPVHVVFTDLLHRRRLQTLQSVDLNVQRLFNELRDVGLLSQTYIIYSSDHGYHLGQFGLVKGKNMPYEFDIRVPFFIRGPDIPRNITIREPVMNVDIAPTILDMAGIQQPSHMDGRSLLPLMRACGTRKMNSLKTVKWRHTVLIERGKMTKLKNVRQRLEKQSSEVEDYSLLRTSCQRSEFSGSCGENQEWECINSRNKWIVVKCHESIEITEECQCGGNKKFSNKSDERKFRTVGTLSELYQSNIKVLIQEQLRKRWKNEFLHYSRQKDLSSLPTASSSIPTLMELSRKKRYNKKRGKRYTNAVIEIVSKNDTYICDPVLFTNYNLWKRALRRWPLPLKLRHINKTNRKMRSERSTVRKCKCKTVYISSLIPEERDDDQVKSDETLTEINQKEMKYVKTKEFEIGVKKSHRSDTKMHCHVPQMNCFSHSADHWRTPPLWPAIYGEFCFCQNANNNTYWCLRTINETHNFLYCEFLTEFISFYDLNLDPYQLKNIVWSVPIGLLEQLNKQLTKLHRCKGVDECEHYSSSSWHSPFVSNEVS